MEGAYIWSYQILSIVRCKCIFKINRILNQNFTKIIYCQLFQPTYDWKKLIPFISIKSSADACLNKHSFVCISLTKGRTIVNLTESSNAIIFFFKNSFIFLFFLIYIIKKVFPCLYLVCTKTLYTTIFIGLSLVFL